MFQISDYKGVKRYVKYYGSIHIFGSYLTAIYDVYNFEIENGVEKQSVDFKNKRVHLTATNDVAVNSKGDFLKSENLESLGLVFFDENNEIILNESGQPAKIGESGIFGQLNFIENLPMSITECAIMEIARADGNKRFDAPINNLNVYEI